MTARATKRRKDKPAVYAIDYRLSLLVLVLVLIVLCVAAFLFMKSRA